MDTVIKLNRLSKHYGTFKAVDDLCLEIRRGEVFGLLGPNGAGKSTTILMMLGLTEPTDGSVSVCGFNATSQPVHVKSKVGYLPEDVGFYDDLTGRENLLFTARLNRLTEEEAKRRVADLLETVGLSHAADKQVKTYSRGMRQRLGLADVLIKNPEVIILDEPTLGIDPSGVRELLNLIQDLAQRKKLTVLLSSHHLHQVQQVCDRVGLFVSGKLIACGSVDDLSRQLFAKEAHQILVSVQMESQVDRHRIKEQLLSLMDVRSVAWLDEATIEVGCVSDRSSEIAKVILDVGASLLQLTRKTYGLDDIYQRYFEEKKTQEVA